MSYRNKTIPRAAIGAIVAVPMVSCVVLPFLGFGAEFIVASSIAATIMSYAIIANGGVLTSGTVPKLQSVGPSKFDWPGSSIFTGIGLDVGGLVDVFKTK